MTVEPPMARMSPIIIAPSFNWKLFPLPFWFLNALESVPDELIVPEIFAEFVAP